PFRRGTQSIDEHCTAAYIDSTDRRANTRIVPQLQHRARPPAPAQEHSMHHSLFACALVGMLAAASPAQGMFRLNPIDSVSVNPGPTANAFRDNRLRAYDNPNSTSARDVRGLLLFDLSNVPDGATIVSMKL